MNDKNNDTKYIVIVDSRERQSTSDLEGYKEYQCTTSHYNELIVNHYNNQCIRCDVAKLCGMNIKIYFYDLEQQHHSINQYHSCPTNGIATSLTFNPNTGFYKRLIYGKAYIVWNDGDLPLSKRQVWGLHEMIKEARELYHDRRSIWKATRQLKKWCNEYQIGIWHPHWFYEQRHCHQTKDDDDEDEIYVDDVSSTSSHGWENDVEHDKYDVPDIRLHSIYSEVEKK